jgi:hypothetical protein
MLLVGAIAGVISFGLVQTMARIFPRGREPAVKLIETRPTHRMRTVTLQ